MPAKNATARPDPAKVQGGCGLGPDDRLVAGGYDWSWAFVVFREMPEFPHRLIGTDGSLWSRFEKLMGAGRAKLAWSHDGPWRRVLLFPSVRGYLTFPMKRASDGKLIQRRIHQLVLEHFIGPCPQGFDPCHNNGIPWDNRVQNLRWDTKKANQADRIRHGTACRGSRHYKTKFTEDDIEKIRNLRSLGQTQQQVADVYRVTRQCISMIERGISWAHKSHGNI